MIKKYLNALRKMEMVHLVLHALLSKTLVIALSYIQTHSGCTGFIAGCGHAGLLLELPAEMLCILVAAKLGYLIYGVVTVGNIIFGKFNAVSEDIFHAGDTKGLFIHYMQVARAYI